MIYNAKEVRKRQLPAEQRLYTLDNFFRNEEIPNRVIFAMVKQESYLSSYKTSLLNLIHFNLEIALVIDGQTIPYRVDIANEIYRELDSALACHLGNEDYSCSTGSAYDLIMKGLVGCVACGMFCSTDSNVLLTIFPPDLTPNHDTQDIQIPDYKVRIWSSYFRQH